MVSGGSGEEDEIPALNLVALIDILTNLLFFLLTIFASQHLTLDQRAGLVLPVDAHPEPLHWSDGTLARPRIQSSRSEDFQVRPWRRA